MSAAAEVGFGPALVRPPDDPGVEAPSVQVVYVYKRTRLADWLCAGAALLWGLTFALPGDVLESSAAYGPLADRFTEETWATILITIGLFRCVALIINGHMAQGSPVIRCISALVGALVWSQALYGFAAFWIATGIPTPGVAATLVPLIGDLVTAARAAVDAIRAKQNGSSR